MQADPKKTPERGFTLMELVLVMVLMATVLAIAAPSLRGFVSRQRGSDAARQIVAAMNEARSRAINEGVVYRLNLDTQTGEYWLTYQVGGVFENMLDYDTESEEKLFTLPDGIEATWIAYGTEVEDEHDDTERRFITFYPTGQTEVAGLRLTDKDSRVVEIATLSASERYHILQEDERMGAARAFEIDR